MDVELRMDWPVAIFIRAEGWYPVNLMPAAECGKTLEDQAAEHAALNPGTQRVEEVGGRILWPLSA